MKEKIKNAEKIFNLLKNELKNYNTSIVASETLDEKIKTPFITLISCLLSLRTKDEITEQASYRLLKKFNTPEKIRSKR